MRYIGVRTATAVLAAVWWAAEPAAGSVLRLEHDGKAYCVAYSPDGKTLATGADHEIVFWDPMTGKRKASLDMGPTSTYSLAYSPDGKTLFAAFGPERPCRETQGKEAAKPQAAGVRAWDVAAQKELYTIKASRAPLMALSPDGKTLVTAVRVPGARLEPAIAEPDVFLWDAETGKAAGKLPDRKESMTALAFSHDGKRLAVGREDGAVELWDLAAKKLLAQVQAVKGSSVDDLAFAPDGGTLIVGNGPFSLVLLDVTNLDDISMRYGGGNVGCNRGGRGCLCYTRDGRTLASGVGREVELLWPGSGKPWRSLPAQLHGPVASMAFSPDGKHLASAGDDVFAYIFQIGDD